MKRNLVNIISIFVIIGSLTSLFFLFPKISFSGIVSWFEGSDDVKVEGEKRENNSEKLKDLNSSSNSLTFGDFLKKEPDAPKRINEYLGDPYMRARSAIAIDAETGTILHYQDGKKRTAIASLTKMMTAILAVENIEDLGSEVVTISKNAAFKEGTVVGCPRTGYCTSNRLRVGEKITAKSLLTATLMNSTNDAAVALGEHIAGSEKAFAEMMNKKAAEIGLTDTHFCNPSGLDEDDKPGQCYSSAYDLARIAAYSLKYDTIWNIMKFEPLDISAVDGTISHHIINTDVLMGEMPNCLGGKTGFTYEAGKSLMMAAHDPNNKNHKVVAVVIDDEYRWEDMKILFNWVFQSYKWPK